MSDEQENKPAAEEKQPETPATETAAEAKAETAEKPAPKKAAKKAAAKKVAEEGAEAKDAEAAEGEGDGESKKSSQPTAEDLLKEEIGEIKIRKAKGSKNVVSGICHILATFNNTKVTFTDRTGKAISWSSAGKCNFRGSRKATAYAAQVVCQDAGRVAMSHGLKEVEVRVKGPGLGRDSAVRALQALGLQVTTIIDVTPVPHNGCRPPKRRRV